MAAEPHDRAGGGKARERRWQHPGARADAERGKAKRKCIGAGGDADRVRHARVGGHPGLEAFDMRPQDEPLVGEDLGHGGPDRGPHLGVLGAQIQKIDSHDRPRQLTNREPLPVRTRPVDRLACSMGPGSVPSRRFMAKKSGWARRLRRVVGTLLVAGVVAVGAVGFVVYREITKDLPPVDQLLSYQPPTTTQVFAEDGTMLGEFYVERRYMVPLDRVPTHVRQAF